MALRDLGWLTDENIHPQVVAFLREEGISVTDVKEEDWYGTTDRVLLQQAYQHQLIIATQDSDFGTLIFRESGTLLGDRVPTSRAIATPSIHSNGSRFTDAIA
jgi:hypothetical protein